MRISVSAEGGRVIAEVVFIASFRSEDEMADRRMQTTRADHQIKAGGWRTLERYAHSVVILLDGRDGVPENRPHATLESFIDQPGEVAAQDTDVTAERRLQGAHAEASGAFSAAIDDPHLIDSVALASQSRNQSHFVKSQSDLFGGAACQPRASLKA